jgi:orotidine-5'-phosphate decarboxylase
VCVGLDASPTWLERWGLGNDVDGVARMCRALCSSIAGEVAAVKLQVAYFERLGAAGIALLADTVADIRAAGALAVLDVKRGDSADSVAAFAEAFLGDGSTIGADAMTASPYMGVAALGPLFDAAGATGSTVFVLVATSNHQAEEVQGARLSDGRTVPQAVADRLGAFAHARAGRTDAPDSLGAAGAIGAVVAAPSVVAHDLVSRLPHAPILAPGLGRAGRSVDEIVAGVSAAADRTLFPVTSGVLKEGPDPDALRRAVDAFQTQLSDVLSVAAR